MKHPFPLRTVEQAQDALFALAKPLPSEVLPVEDAVGRGLSQGLPARRTLPPWDNSAMDGYAVRAADLQTLPSRLAVVERIYAGHSPTRRLGPGECAQIMTGAPVPPGADTVVMQEHVQVLESEQAVRIERAFAEGSNIRRRGEDVQEGQPLLNPGDALGVAEAGLLWAQGITSVVVPRRPRVAIVSSGDELCPVDAPREGAIVDSNSPTLALACQRVGATARRLGIAHDAPESLEMLLRQAVSDDVVLVSAGVSVGERDYTRDVLSRLGVQTVISGVAIKPGKPLFVGVRDGCLFFGLPGNPVSSLVTFELFVRPTLRRLLGHREVRPPRVLARLAGPLKKSAGLEHYLRCRPEWVGSEWRAYPLKSQSSGALRSIASATHLLHLPADTTFAAEGDEVSLLPLSWPG